MILRMHLTIVAVISIVTLAICHMAWINTSLTVTLIGLFRKYTLRRLRGTFRLFTVFQVRKVKMPFVRAESERIIAGPVRER